MHGIEDVFYNRYSKQNIFWCLFSLRLIFWENLISEGRSVWVEGHAEILRFLLGENLLESITEPQHSRRILPFGVEPWATDKSIVSPIDEGVGIEKE